MYLSQINQPVPHFFPSAQCLSVGVMQLLVSDQKAAQGMFIVKVFLTNSFDILFFLYQRFFDTTNVSVYKLCPEQSTQDPCYHRAYIQVNKACK